VPELTELTCPNCAAKVGADRSAAQVQCAHCGAGFVIERMAIPVAPEIEPERCPKRGKVDRAQKASSVHTSGISRGYYDGYCGHSRMDLSWLLAPSAQPRRTSWLGRLLFLLGGLCLAGTGSAAACIGLFALCIVSWGIGDSAAHPKTLMVALLRSALAAGVLFGAPVLLLLFLLSIGVALLVAGRKLMQWQTRQFLMEKPAWENAVRRWQRMYYCARDDGVFIPGEASFMPIDKVQELLYAD
jgi:hypothetical protein